MAETFDFVQEKNIALVPSQLFKRPLQRHSHEPLLERVLDLRDVFSAYDAAYVALAEQVGAALLTGDLRLARAIRASRVVDVELA